MPDEPTTVDAYVAGVTDDQRPALAALRSLVLELLPGAEERISYRMPTVTLEGRPVLHYAAWTKHLSLYPVPRGDDDFEAVVAPYRAAKDAVHLRYDRPLPTDVVTRIVRLLAERHATARPQPTRP
ncbi:iron chaperone [Nocardioides iriomotensis]|uniref:YdhG-like domain-containing protein n=1 Tax=Nocardioides iriomotensis TaxID=715784 RepID=A0A4Q5IVY2_9ACTN|nr:DUF1801 domain-containing protein [Nocardioides iriomotensis]RYU10182.1 hypothetical protein ETU37_17375 [Nocardioides iriomotensis]